MQDIDDIWQTIELQLQEQFPAVFQTLAPPASEADVARLESRFGAILPSDLKESLLRHDGQQPRNTLANLVKGNTLLSVEGILDVWSVWQELAADPMYVVHPSNDTSEEIGTGVVWHPKWLPFTETGSGWHHVIDFGPRSKGVVGQVFHLAHGEPGEM